MLVSRALTPWLSTRTDIITFLRHLHSAEQSSLSIWPHTTTTWTFICCFQLPVVRFEYVRTFFDITQSQESEVFTYEFYTAIYIKTHLDDKIYLSSRWTNRSLWGHFLILLNLKYFNASFQSQLTGVWRHSGPPGLQVSVLIDRIVWPSTLGNEMWYDDLWGVNIEFRKNHS